MKHIRAFTLVELLVVIAIMTLIASIILSGLRVSRDNGSIGAGNVFDSSLFHASGDNIFLIWPFDESSGPTMSDTSGNGYDGSIISGIGTAVAHSADTRNGIGGSFQTPQAISVWVERNFGASSFVPLPGTMTVSVWVKPGTIAANGKGLTFGVGAGAFLNLGFSATLDPIIQNFGGNTVTGSSKIEAGKWSHVAFVYKSVTPTICDMYINGKKIGSSGTCDAMSPSFQFIRLGQGALKRQFLFDDMRIYTTSLLAAQIGEMYAQGLLNHPLAVRR